MKLFFAVLVFSFSTAWGQELATELPEKDQQALEVPTNVMGMIQYVDGDLKWIGGDHNEEPQFRSFFRTGDKIELEDDDSLVKVVTNEGCVGVAYGPGQIQAPFNQGQAWKAEATSLRWICESSYSQNLLVHGQNIEVKGGEMAITEDKLLVLQPIIRAKGDELAKNLLYEKTDEGNWQLADKQPGEYELWELDDDLRKPIESLILARPTSHYRHRLIFSFAPGVGSFKHDDLRFDEAKVDADGAQIQYQRLWGSKYLTFHLGFFDLQDPKGDEQSNQPDPPDTELRLTRADIGLRWLARKTWGIYARTGLAFGSLESDGNLFDDNGNLQKSFNFESSYNFVTLTLGVEKTFFKETVESWGLWGWHGLYLAVDLQVIKSISASNNRVDEFFIASGATAGIEDSITEASVFGAAVTFSIGLPFGL